MLTLFFVCEPCIFKKLFLIPLTFVLCKRLVIQAIISIKKYEVQYDLDFVESANRPQPTSL